jgi:hypothetical protein
MPGEAVPVMLSVSPTNGLDGVICQLTVAATGEINKKSKRNVDSKQNTIPFLFNCMCIIIFKSFIFINAVFPLDSYLLNYIRILQLPFRHNIGFGIGSLLYLIFKF